MSTIKLMAPQNFVGHFWETNKDENLLSLRLPIDKLLVLPVYDTWSRASKLVMSTQVGYSWKGSALALLGPPGAQGGWPLTLLKALKVPSPKGLTGVNRLPYPSLDVMLQSYIHGRNDIGFSSTSIFLSSSHIFISFHCSLCSPLCYCSFFSSLLSHGLLPDMQHNWPKVTIKL